MVGASRAAPGAKPLGNRWRAVAICHVCTSTAYGSVSVCPQYNLPRKTVVPLPTEAGSTSLVSSFIVDRPETHRKAT